MKINLILNNEKVAVTPELITYKIQQLLKLLQEQEVENQETFSTSNIDNQINNVALLLRDMGYDITAKEVQNIVKKDNPSDEKENLATNLYEALNFFLSKKKLIHQNNISILYKIISNNTSNLNNNLFRVTNEVESLSYPSRYFKILDFNSVPSLFDQLIEFINIDDSQLSIFLNMQIVHLHNLAMSPFAQYNAVLSKIISL
ncbi:MAG: hypothetical protein QJQ54_03370 [Mollicutes bacterium]|nr:MAG: hypothetical protein QJQ54_03370 [Mollicutes bacterium]